MSNLKKVMLSMSLVMSLAALVADNNTIEAVYIVFAGFSLYLGLPDKEG